MQLFCSLEPFWFVVFCFGISYYSRCREVLQNKMDKIDFLLLRGFEPVLRFSAGERFFPMDVHDFIANCRLKKSRRLWKDQDCTEDWYSEARQLDGTARGDKPSPEALAKALAGFDNQHYLHFVHGKDEGRSGGRQGLSSIYIRYPRFILLLSILALIVLPAYGLFSERV